MNRFSLPSRPPLVVGGLTLLAAAACTDRPPSDPGPLAPDPVATAAVHASALPPAELEGSLAQVQFGTSSLHVWPFTGTDFSGQPSDPINLLFVGESDPANVRAALLALDGNRTDFGYPPAKPFDCTWRDAAGGIQATWAAGEWTGSVIQLECGEYETLRFHLRLFPSGEWTAANAHLDLLIPGTPNHQVLSWDLARQLVVVDLLRTGLLHPDAPMSVQGGLTPGPTFREIPAAIYNGLPSGLRDLIGGPPVPVQGGVGIANDGSAVIANLAGRGPVVQGTARYELELPFDQVVPRPMCQTSPTDWIHALGHVRILHRVTTTPQGEVSSEIQVVGSLDVTPLDLATGQPTGSPRRAQIADHYSASSLARTGRVLSQQLRLLTASGGTAEPESERTRFRVGPDGLTDFARITHCSD
jgi:hypothetical protein